MWVNNTKQSTVLHSFTFPYPTPARVQAQLAHIKANPPATRYQDSVDEQVGTGRRRLHLPRQTIIVRRLSASSLPIQRR